MHDYFDMFIKNIDNFLFFKVNFDVFHRYFAENDSLITNFALVGPALYLVLFKSHYEGTNSVPGTSSLISSTSLITGRLINGFHCIF